jgi:hypothetical protein
MHDREFKLFPSKRFRLAMAFFVLITICIAAALPLSLWLRLPLIFFTGWYGVYCCHYPVESLRRLTDGSWLVQTKQGIYAATLQGESIVTGYVSILCFQLKDSKRLLTSIVFPDSLRSDYYRRLLVTIRRF